LCDACNGRAGTALFADVAEGAAETAAEEVPEEAVVAEIPSEVEALDGVESSEEAHNVDRPARKELKKKKPQGQGLSEFKAGSMVKGSVRSITNYGAFIDFGATTDGLLHISQLSNEYVADVGSILKEGQEIEVRIISIDSEKGQVALSLMTEEQAASSTGGQQRPQRGGSNRRDDTATLAGLQEKGWDPAAFVEGLVVSTVDFGCFVRIDSKALNGECEGELDGLVHISALRAGRVNSVTEVVSANQKVQVRVKSISGSKVSLTMLSVEDEESKNDSYNNSGVSQDMGAKDWKESLGKFEDKMPTFSNGPLVENRRK
jgi:elongation factor Ts